MKNIIPAKNQGFCLGVRRALDIVNKHEQAYILGDLIHNKQVVKTLEKSGKKVIRKINGREDKPVVITAHGNVVEIFHKLREFDIQIIDATCPLVSLIYKVGERLEAEGRRIVIIGDKNHIEVKGIASRMSDPFIINSLEELAGIQFPDKTGVICQSTFSERKFGEIVDVLRSKTKDLKVKNTICLPTKKRQKAAEELAKKADIVITVGGYHSSNTKKLAELAARHTESRHVELAAQLDPQWFKDKNIIGVAAGASTPDWIIQEICDKIQTFIQPRT